MIRLLIICIAGGLIGLILGMSGINCLTWQFWVIEILILVLVFTFKYL